MTRWGWLVVLALSGCAHGPEPTPEFDALVRSLPRDWAGAVPYEPARLRGRVVLVTFIATWCFPCLADLVTLKKLQDVYGPEGFSNVLVGMDREGHKVLDPFALGYDLACPLVVSDEALRVGDTPFGHVRELPTRVLFGRDGKVVVGYTGVANYESLEKVVVKALR